MLYTHYSEPYPYIRKNARLVVLYRYFVANFAHVWGLYNKQYNTTLIVLKFWCKIKLGDKNEKVFGKNK